MRIYLLLLLLSISSCISEYTPENIEATDGLLVVEGFITNNISTIRLSRSIGLKDDISTAEVVNKATVYVEVDNGTELRTTSYRGNGRYDIATGAIDPNLRYRLRIKIDSNEYESEYLSPLQTPPVDSVYAIKKGDGQLVRMYVATHGSEEAPSYYLWSYWEYWELQAQEYSPAYHENPYDPSSPVHEYSLLTSNNIYYCWGKDSSRTLILGSSDHLKENVITQQKLTEVDPSDNRLEILYYIKVAQTQLHKECYSYLENMRKNTEEMGGLFSSMPSDLKGNLRCVTNPSQPVIGYVDVTTTTYKERFFDYPTYRFAEGFQRYSTCDLPSSYEHGYLICSLNRRLSPTGGITTIDYLPAECLDCRLKGGSKERPPFWPNNHY